jgi:hypothetical protein
MALADVSGFADGFVDTLGGEAFGVVAALAADVATTAATPALVALLALAAAFLVLSLTISTGFAALIVPAIFVAFVALVAVTGLVTPRRLAAVVVLRSAGRVVLLRAAWPLGALDFLFRISTVVVFLSIVFPRAAALLFEVPARAVLRALF